MKAVFLDADTLGPEDIDLDPLTSLLPDIQYFPSTASELIAARIHDADIVLTNKAILSAELLQQAQNLKLICLAATGTDNIAIDYAQQAGITVCNIRDYCTPAAVQHVFALILSLTQRLDLYSAALDRNAWSECEQFSLLDYPIRELAGKTMGIIGYGSLGKAVGDIARAFGMQIMAAQQPYSLTNEITQEQSNAIPQRVGLRTLLSSSDIISLHCPLTLATENLINADTLKCMRSGAILINTSRGALIDSAALVNAIKAGQIAGAGIDVLKEEPPRSPEPLLEARLPNLIVTPHIAWAAVEARQRAVAEMARNVEAWLAGQPRNVCAG